MRVAGNGDKTFISSYSGGTFPLRVGYGTFASFTPTFVINDSGNVGIGTASPDGKLSIYSTATYDPRSSGINIHRPGSFGQRGSLAYDGDEFQFSSTYSGNGATNWGTFRFQQFNNGTTARTAMFINTAGNVGIGTTSPSNALTIYGSSTGGFLYPSIKGITKIGVTDYTLFLMEQYGGNEGFLGLYFDNIKKIQLRSNGDSYLNGGNVGIGTTSPDSKLHIEGSSGDNNLFAVGDVAIPTSGAEYGVAMIKTASTEFALNITSYSLTGKGVRIYNNGNNGPRTSFEILQGSGSKFIVDGIGNVGIGLTNPTDKLAVAGNISIPGAYKIYNGSASDSAGLTFPSSVFRIDGFSGITFNSSTTNIGSQTERMRITNTGNVGIGTTSPGSKLMISDANNRNFYDAQFKIEGSGYTAAHYLDGTEYMIHQNSNTRRIRMMSGTSISGVLLNPGATAWSSPSDERLKENIKPLDNVLDKIKDYRCVEYNFKNDKSKGKKIGFIAQDWVDDFPVIVDKDNKGLLDMKYTETIPVLLKAIQELKAEIEILKNK
jgi:hypothetical protein